MNYLQKSGYYTIINRSNNKALDVYSYDFEINAKLRQCSLSSYNNQIFYFEKQLDNTFTIMAAHSGLFLECIENKDLSNFEIMQKSKNNLYSQNFYVEEITPGFFTIKSKSSQKLLTVKSNVNESAFMSPLNDNISNFQMFSLKSAQKNNILIPNGYYKITNKNSNNVLDVYNFNFGESVLKQDIWNGGNNQIFYFEMQKDGAYTIKAAHSNMYLQAATTDGLTINQYPANLKDDQRFYIEEDAPGTFYIKSKVLSRVLGALNGSKDRGVKIIQYLKKDDNNQKFNFKLVSKNPINHPNVAFIDNGYYKIQSFKNNKFLTIKDFSMLNNAEAILSNDNNANNQIFNFLYLSNGAYAIKPCHSNLSLTIKENPDLLVQQDYLKAQNQHFYIEPYRDKYRLKSVETGKVLDINQDGTKIQQFEENFTNGQIFNLIKSSKNPNNTSADIKRNEIITTAKKYLGTPYVWGGAGPNGFDCSGFVQYVYKQAGITVSRTTYTQVNEGVKVANSSLTLADLIFFGTSQPSHVGIYIGNSEYIHSPEAGDVVKISTLKYYLTARRILI